VRRERAVEQRTEAAHVVGNLTCVAARSGDLTSPGTGLYADDRRVLARWDLTADDQGPAPVSTHSTGASTHVLAVARNLGDRGPDPTVEVHRRRTLVDGVPDPGQRRVGDPADRVRVGQEAVRGGTARADDGERDGAVEHVVPGTPGDRRALRVTGDALEQAVSIADGPRGSRSAGVGLTGPPRSESLGPRRPAPGHVPTGTCRGSGYDVGCHRVTSAGDRGRFSSRPARCLLTFPWRDVRVAAARRRARRTAEHSGEDEPPPTASRPSTIATSEPRSLAEGVADQHEHQPGRPASTDMTRNRTEARTVRG
jgi:hypothetical protein